jgi:hypothetical protein
LQERDILRLWVACLVPVVVILQFIPEVVGGFFLDGAELHEMRRERLQDGEGRGEVLQGLRVVR